MLPTSSAIASSADDLAKFGQSVNILGEVKSLSMNLNGQMQRTDQDFIDGLAIDLFSPTPRSLVVNQKSPPSAPASAVRGTTGEPWIFIYNYSWVINLNETALDLVGAKIEAPYDPVELKRLGVTDDNTYVARLSGDGKSWVVDDATRNIHRYSRLHSANRENGKQNQDPQDDIS